MMTEQNMQEKTSLLGWIRYFALAVLAVYLIWWSLKPPIQKAKFDPKSEQPVTATTVIAVTGTTMGPIPYCVKVASAGVTEEQLPGKKERLQKEVQAVLDAVDRMMSTYKADSEVSRFNAFDSTDWFSVSSETAHVVAVAQDVSALTNGAFDVTVAPLVDRWGFGPKKMPQDQWVAPTPEELQSLKELVGYQKLHVRSAPPALRKDAANLRIDLSGVAKGYAVDRLAAQLESLNFEHYMIEVGGETRTKGEKSPGKEWLIGIEIPIPEWMGEPKIIRLVHLGSRSMATSGDYRNFLEDEKGQTFSHILDSRTGCPTGLEINTPLTRERLGSLSVIDRSCARADALATGLFVLGPEEGLKLANDKKIPVLFLLRSENLDSTRSTPHFTVRDILSDSFKQDVQSWKPE